MDTINTPYGKKWVVRRVGTSGEYYYTTPTPNAPNGAWWTLNPQRGFVPVSTMTKGLQDALACAGEDESR